MKKNTSFTFLFGLVALLLLSVQKKETQPGLTLKIEWVKNMTDNFSFHHQWSYPEGVYQNEFGQLSCDGLCPPETDAMKDANGKIYPDSLARFYALVDTSHLPHSIQCEAHAFQWAGTHFIQLKKTESNTVEGQTACNVATHSSLHLTLDGNQLSAYIKLIRVTNGTNLIFPLTKGSIQVDKEYYKRGVIKAIFDLEFENTASATDPLFWRGKIYAPIEA